MVEEAGGESVRGAIYLQRSHQEGNGKCSSQTGGSHVKSLCKYSTAQQYGTWNQIMHWGARDSTGVKPQHLLDVGPIFLSSHLSPLLNA